MIQKGIAKFFFSRQDEFVDGFWYFVVCAAAVKALTRYEAIPHYMKETLRDPHEYKLRTMQDIKNELKETDGHFKAEVDIIYKDYNDAKFHESALNRKVNMAKDEDMTITLKEVWLNVKLKNWNLTRNQSARLRILLGNREMSSDHFVISCAMYDKPELNFEKLVQQIKELYLETKRAP